MTVAAWYNGDRRHGRSGCTRCAEPEGLLPHQIFDGSNRVAAVHASPRVRFEHSLFLPACRTDSGLLRRTHILTEVAAHVVSSLARDPTGLDMRWGARRRTRNEHRSSTREMWHSGGLRCAGQSPTTGPTPVVRRASSPSSSSPNRVAAEQRDVLSAGRRPVPRRLVSSLVATGRGTFRVRAPVDELLVGEGGCVEGA